MKDEQGGKNVSCSEVISVEGGGGACIVAQAILRLKWSWLAELCSAAHLTPESRGVFTGRITSTLEDLQALPSYSPDSMT